MDIAGRDRYDPLTMPADDFNKTDSGPGIHTLTLSELIGRATFYETLSAELANRLCATHDRLARDLLTRFDGREIEKAHRFLLLFERPIDAVHYCLAYHEGLRKLSEDFNLPVNGRTAIHLGEVFFQPNSRKHRDRGARDVDAEGPARTVVARMIPLVEGGQILLTKTAYELSRRAAVGDEESESRLRWRCHGEFRLEGMEEPVEIFEVAIAGVAPLAAPVAIRRLEIRGDETDRAWRAEPGEPVPHRPNFILRRQLGESPFGVRWLAVHGKTHVARVFHFGSDESELARLKRQAEIHRHLKKALGQRDDISRIFDGNFDQPPYFLVSEHVAGDDLLTWAREELRRTPLEARLEIVARVAETLAAIHSAGVAHGNLRASSLRILPSGEAAFPTVRLTEIEYGLILGPAEDEERNERLRADVQALGALLYQVVVGDLSRPPGPFWERSIDDDLLRQDIARLIDPAVESPAPDVSGFPELLRSLPQRLVHRAAEERQEEIRRSRQQARERRRGWLRTAALVLIVALIAFFLGIWVR